MSVFNSLQNSLQSYPIQWAGFIRALILGSVAFGLKLTGEQIAAVMLVVESGLTVYTHQTITDNAVQDEQNAIEKGTPPDSPSHVIVK